MNRHWKQIMTEVSRLPDGKKHWSFLSDTPPDLPGHYFMSTTRGFMTVFVAFMLLLNDIGEFIWGWPDYEFSVDKNKSSFLNINVDMVVAMPCNRECPHSSSRHPADSSGQS